MASPPPTNGVFLPFYICTFTECSRNAIGGGEKQRLITHFWIKGKKLTEKIERMKMEINYGCQTKRTSCALRNSVTTTAGG